MPVDTNGSGGQPVERPVSLSQKLDTLLQQLRERLPGVHRLAVAVYDRQTDLLKTFLSSGDEPSVLSNYQARLADVPSLRALADRGVPRVIDDLQGLAESDSEHTRRLQAVGFAASYTLPMLHDGELFGFFFCDSRQRAYFTASVAGQLDPLLRLVALTVVCELRAIRTLAAATATARHITSHRDFETGAHLERMANYSRLIARDLADEVNLSDEYIEHLFLFAPLHDIGKIAIPDSILLKTGPLTHDEFAQMQTHPAKGLQMVDFMLQEFSLTTLAHAGVLRHVVFMHHEAFDGSGYPQGLRGEAIPLEARIVAAADMFDALTSLRPYKPAWPIEIALAELSRFAGKKLDPRCVQALHAHRGEIEAVRERFQETVYG